MTPSHTAEKRRVLVELLQSNPTFSKDGLHLLTAEQRKERSKRMSEEIPALFFSSGLEMRDMDLVVDVLGEPLPNQMHWSMFLSSIQNLASESQKQKWLPLCISGEVRGCYAQTELGGGSDVKGIETTAECVDCEWILHSPTLTSTKFWPGGLGENATHALVVCKTPSLRMFLVDLSSPGVTRGSIGPLMGFQGADNGWLRLNHVRALEAFPEVPRGTLYGTMRSTRKRIIRASLYSLAKAVTIAYSFACVRQAPKGVLILEHAHVRNTIQKWTDFVENTKMQSHLSFKAYVTDEVAKGIEECRRICGGFGYATFSGFPELLANHLAAVTYEGSNEMLYAMDPKVYTTDGPQSHPIPQTIQRWQISEYECGSVLVGEDNIYARIMRSVSKL